MSVVRLGMDSLWPQAVAEGLVSGTAQEAYDSILDILAVGAGRDGQANEGHRAIPSSILRRGKIRLKDLQRVGQWARLRRIGFYDQASTAWTNGILEGLDALTRKAAEKGWTKPRYTAAVQELADRVGASGIRGGWIETWYRTHVLNAGYTSGLLTMVRNEPTVRLYPFFEATWIDDAKTRENHKIVWVVASTSTKALLFKAPYEWNCRCGMRAMNWQEARARFTAEQLLLEEPDGSRRTLSGIPPVTPTF